MNFTFCKNRCNYTKRNKQSRNPPLSVQSFQNRTIPRKSPTPLPPLSKVRCCRLKKFGRLPEGLPQLHRPSPSPQPLQKDNSTLLRTTFLPYERSVGFASLRNSGRSTSGIHARPLSKVRCCRPKEFGRLPE